MPWDEEVSFVPTAVAFEEFCILPMFDEKAW